MTKDIGKVLRDGAGQACNRSNDEVLDLVISNALIIDWSGIYKVTQAGSTSSSALIDRRISV